MEFFKLGECAWKLQQIIEIRSFNCGYCGFKVASDRGYKIGYGRDGNGQQAGAIYICSSCQGPNFLSPAGYWHPGQPYGRVVRNVPSELEKLYEEARSCVKEKCYTASVLLCRKMLMNIAVAQGAKAGLKFIEYVTFLSEKGFIPPNGKQWVDHIRKKGNEATHEIALMGEQDAKDLITFSEMLLIFLHEFPSMISE